ncbi:hypothetical protein QYF61_027586 [Mycteria americana]|uniref:Integrase zinc-binding domain-containing protein n=1 Tax=Mycteria americana TaxID=33587 RepID=A0AAN7N9W2_MYCAM|nr:hypothetical protein QYF61_027586 [Mycteria americana]
MNPIRSQQTRCCVGHPVVKKTKSVAMTPATEPCINRLGVSVLSCVTAHHWKERGENNLLTYPRVYAHIPKSQATEEHQNNQQVDQAAKIEVAQVDLDWQHKSELFIAWWTQDSSGHQGRDATYRWAGDRGVDLTMDTIAQVIHECETCAAIKQAKQLNPLWYGG